MSFANFSSSAYLRSATSEFDNEKTWRQLASTTTSSLSLKTTPTPHDASTLSL